MFSRRQQGGILLALLLVSCLPQTPHSAVIQTGGLPTAPEVANTTTTTCLMQAAEDAAGFAQNGNECSTPTATTNTLDKLQVDAAALSLAGVANITETQNGSYQIKTQMKVSENCPSLTTDAAALTQTQLIELLTAPCRYDRLERPAAADGDDAVKVFARAYVYVMQNLQTSELKIKMQGLLQLRYQDARLAYGAIWPQRQQPIMGQSELRKLIWLPHIFLANEHDSSVLGTNEQDILTAISADGTVIISTRMQATLYCWMDLSKFPFDEQDCSTIFESWMYNTSQLLLHWEPQSALTFDTKMHLTEYALMRYWTNESVINADLTDLRHGAFAGNYSSLSFTVHLTREVGYYVMDYFLPSIMIVAISWVSFWLQADQTPARTTLGTSTLLSFITLASSQDNNLPKVNYVKISEIWFLGCTCFIFGSLVEFAFVNTIWRRSRSLQLKKINSKYIFKSTLTPRNKRSNKLQRCASTATTTTTVMPETPVGGSYSNFLTIETPSIVVEDDQDNDRLEMRSTNNFFNANNSSNNSSCISIESSNEHVEGDAAQEQSDDKQKSWTTMTPHEVSLWIDRKARFAFPLMFIIFNAFFWTFVYCL